MTARTLDHRHAISERDAHAYYAITTLAQREGLSPADWYAKYRADGLPFMLEMAYVSLVIMFEQYVFRAPQPSRPRVNGGGGVSLVNRRRT